MIGEARLDKADEIIKKGGWDAIVISGGRTRAHFPSEAELGLKYLRDTLRSNAEVLLEDCSKTTADNIAFTRALKELSGVCVERVLVVTGAYHVPRFRLLFAKLWPETRVSFVGLGTSTLKLELYEWILRFLGRIDPRGRWTLPVLVYFMRNGNGSTP